MATQQGDGPFRLSSLPSELWSMARLIEELRADDQTVRRWVRERQLPGPCLRRNGRAYWNPADVEFYRRKRLRRVGAEIGEAVGRDKPDGSRGSTPNGN
jgi:hypothetical protein